MRSFLFWLIVISSVLAISWWAFRRAKQLREEAEQREAAAFIDLMALPEPKTAPSTASNTSPALLTPASAALTSELNPPEISKAPASYELLPMVLAFYQWRGYQRITPQASITHLRAVLQHPQQLQRLYALIEWPEQEKLSGKQLAQLARDLHQQDFDYAIVVAAAGFDFDALALAKNLHFRLYDRVAITARLQELPVALQTKLAQIDSTASSSTARS